MEACHKPMPNILPTPAGASFGKWRGLWSPEEAEDSLHILDWIAEQQWSSGQVLNLVHKLIWGSCSYRQWVLQKSGCPQPWPACFMHHSHISRLLCPCLQHDLSILVESGSQEDSVEGITSQARNMCDVTMTVCNKCTAVTPRLALLTGGSVWNELWGDGRSVHAHKGASIGQGCCAALPLLGPLQRDLLPRGHTPAEVCRELGQGHPGTGCQQRWRAFAPPEHILQVCSTLPAQTIIVPVL